MMVAINGRQEPDVNTQNDRPIHRLAWLDFVGCTQCGQV
jgi:hypothetical protein